MILLEKAQKIARKKALVRTMRLRKLSNTTRARTLLALRRQAERIYR